MLRIDDYTFNEDYTTRDTAFLFLKEEEDMESCSWSIDCSFEAGKFVTGGDDEEEYEDESVSPSICINPIETEKHDVSELVGETFEVTNVEDAEEREDSFYIYDAEPIVEYKIQILEIKNDKIRIKCNGTMSVDYEELHSFEMDSWLPIIQDLSDWNKYNLLKLPTLKMNSVP